MRRPPIKNTKINNNLKIFIIEIFFLATILYLCNTAHTSYMILDSNLVSVHLNIKNSQFFFYASFEQKKTSFFLVVYY